MTFKNKLAAVGKLLTGPTALRVTGLTTAVGLLGGGIAQAHQTTNALATSEKQIAYLRKQIEAQPLPEKVDLSGVEQKIGTVEQNLNLVGGGMLASGELMKSELNTRLSELDKSREEDIKKLREALEADIRGLKDKVGASEKDLGVKLDDMEVNGAGFRDKVLERLYQLESFQEEIDDKVESLHENVGDKLAGLKDDFGAWKQKATGELKIISNNQAGLIKLVAEKLNDESEQTLEKVNSLKNIESRLNEIESVQEEIVDKLDERSANDEVRQEEMRSRFEGLEDELSEGVVINLEKLEKKMADYTNQVGEIKKRAKRVVETIVETIEETKAFDSIEHTRPMEPINGANAIDLEEVSHSPIHTGGSIATELTESSEGDILEGNDAGVFERTEEEESGISGSYPEGTTIEVEDDMCCASCSEELLKKIDVLEKKLEGQARLLLVFRNTNLSNMDTLSGQHHSLFTMMKDLLDQVNTNTDTLLELADDVQRLEEYVKPRVSVPLNVQTFSVYVSEDKE